MICGLFPPPPIWHYHRPLLSWTSSHFRVKWAVIKTFGPERGSVQISVTHSKKALGALDFCSRLRRSHGPRDSVPRCPGLAALLGRVAPCGACVVRVRREHLALSVRQDVVSLAGRYRLSTGAYLNTALSVGHKNYSHQLLIVVEFLEDYPLSSIY